MRYNTIAGAVLTAASAVIGKEIAKDEALAAGKRPPLLSWLWCDQLLVTLRD